jgi:hypothetical protein
MQLSQAKTVASLIDVKSNLTKLEQLNVTEQLSVKGGGSTCTTDLRRKDKK